MLNPLYLQVVLLVSFLDHCLTPLSLYFPFHCSYVKSLINVVTSRFSTQFELDEVIHQNTLVSPTSTRLLHVWKSWRICGLKIVIDFLHHFLQKPRLKLRKKRKFTNKKPAALLKLLQLLLSRRTIISFWGFLRELPTTFVIITRDLFSHGILGPSENTIYWSLARKASKILELINSQLLPGKGCKTKPFFFQTCGVCHIADSLPVYH